LAALAGKRIFTTRRQEEKRPVRAPRKGNKNKIHWATRKSPDFTTVGPVFLKKRCSERPLFRKKVPNRGAAVPSLENPPPHLNDLDRWIEAARRGSGDALGQVLAYCQQYLLALADHELTPDLQAKLGASDLVQDTFLEALRDFGKFQGDS
jgi:hypothetical protein